MTRFPVRSSATARLLLRGSLLLCAFVAQPALAQVKCGQGVSDAVCPYITSPSVGGFVDERGTLRWHPVKGTAQYRYIIDSDRSRGVAAANAAAAAAAAAGRHEGKGEGGGSAPAVPTSSASPLPAPLVATSLLPLEELRRRASRGEIEDGPSAFAILLAAEKLDA